MSTRKEDKALTEQRRTNETQEIEMTEPQARQQEWNYRPDADIVELGDSYRILADVPGAKHDTVGVSFEDGILSIDARVESRYPRDAEFAVQEFGVGNYHRRFRISEDVDVEHIDAEYNLGVLTVTLPKRKAAQRRQIEVKAG